MGRKREQNGANSQDDNNDAGHSPDINELCKDLPLAEIIGCIDIDLVVNDILCHPDAFDQKPGETNDQTYLCRLYNLVSDIVLSLQQGQKIIENRNGD